MSASATSTFPSLFAFQRSMSLPSGPLDDVAPSQKMNLDFLLVNDAEKPSAPPFFVLKPAPATTASNIAQLPSFSRLPDCLPVQQHQHQQQQQFDKRRTPPSVTAFASATPPLPSGAPSTAVEFVFPSPLDDQHRPAKKLKSPLLPFPSPLMAPPAATPSSFGQHHHQQQQVLHHQHHQHHQRHQHHHHADAVHHHYQLQQYHQHHQQQKDESSLALELLALESLTEIARRESSSSSSSNSSSSSGNGLLLPSAGSLSSSSSYTTIKTKMKKKLTGKEQRLPDACLMHKRKHQKCPPFCTGRSETFELDEEYGGR